MGDAVLTLLALLFAGPFIWIALLTQWLSKGTAAEREARGYEAFLLSILAFLLAMFVWAALADVPAR